MRIVWIALVLLTTGCGQFAARRMAQSPNTYPEWIAPNARVTLGFRSNFLTNFPGHRVEIADPKATLFYRVVEPADYHFSFTSTNWFAKGRKHYKFSFYADLRVETNHWAMNPRGTVLLLHGYGVSQFAMAPWALVLAKEGWRCVLVDLRGHGKSSGKRIYYGTQEVKDLSKLLDDLASRKELAVPVAVVAQSYGASTALRWKGLDSRVGPVVAIAPYAGLSNAVLNIGHDYAKWVPKSFLRAGLRELPKVLGVNAKELDTTAVLRNRPVPALFIASEEDKVTLASEVKELADLSPGSKLIVLPDATHEALTYFLGELTGPVVSWLGQQAN